MRALVCLCLAALSAAASPPRASGLPEPVSHGFNIHFTDPRPGELELLAAAGVTWVRMDFVWSATEREAGVYDFAAYDRLMAALDRNHLRALLILDYANRLYDGGLAPHTGTGRAAFARWAAAAAAHFRGRGVVWEMWNEPNLEQFWKPHADAADYVALARATGRAIRDADPDACFVGPAASCIDVPFLEQCFEGGLLEDWAAVTVHPYRQSGPETVAAEYGRLRDLIDRYAPKGKQIPILSGEWGFDAAWGGCDEARQGDLLPRQWLVNAACGVPLSIWYDWRDDGTDPKEPEHHFGTVAHAYHADRDPPYDLKPAYRAARALAEALRGFQFDRRLAPPREDGRSSPDDWVLLFRRGDERILAAWTTGTNTPGIRPLPGGSIPLARQPQYVPVPAAAVLIETKDDWSDARITAVALAPAASGRVAAVVTKSYGPPLRGRVVASTGAAEDLALDAGEARATVILNTAADASLVSVEMQRDDGRTIHRTAPRRIVPLAGFSADELAVQANTDGHGDVASTQLIADVAAPPGLPAGSATALRFEATCAAGFKYFPVVPRQGDRPGVPGQPVALGFWVHGEGDPATLTCRLRDASGEVFQPAHVRSASGWHYIELRFTGPGHGHWGGNQNDAIDWPARWEAPLLVDRDHAQPYRGTLHLSGPVLIYE